MTPAQRVLLAAYGVVGVLVGVGGALVLARWVAVARAVGCGSGLVLVLASGALAVPTLAWEYPTAVPQHTGFVVQGSRDLGRTWRTLAQGLAPRVRQWQDGAAPAGTVTCYRVYAVGRGRVRSGVTAPVCQVTVRRGMARRVLVRED